MKDSDLPTLREILIGVVAALVIFAGAEQLTLPLQLWEPNHQKVRVMVLDVALYVLPAEAALGAVLVVAYSLTRAGDTWQDFWKRLVAGVSVAVFYTGALCISWLLIEQAP